jgi:hypothetical protein
MGSVEEKKYLLMQWCRREALGALLVLAALAPVLVLHRTTTIHAAGSSSNERKPRRNPALV